MTSHARRVGAEMRQPQRTAISNASNTRKMWIRGTSTRRNARQQRRNLKAFVWGLRIVVSLDRYFARVEVRGCECVAHLCVLCTPRKVSQHLLYYNIRFISGNIEINNACVRSEIENVFYSLSASKRVERFSGHKIAEYISALPGKMFSKTMFITKLAWIKSEFWYQLNGRRNSRGVF